MNVFLTQLCWVAAVYGLLEVDMRRSLCDELQ